MLVQDPRSSHANHYTWPGSQWFTCKSLQMSRITMIHTQILMLVQDPDISEAIPNTCPGSQQFTCKSLCLSRIKTLHTQILTLVQDPNVSDCDSKLEHKHDSQIP
ncbi:hypothetical protein O181_001349 [Austropuccinia psidii MF-1]|uniref:Uncharacterized protein n=1 Tax=Austropuccinia psidii MF-1 TaxID=1389203 RepID=A0A9Q3GBS3_9BASI|nr:hypothetical protein [Austropuccinia psidii MF-1]